MNAAHRHRPIPTLLTGCSRVRMTTLRSHQSHLRASHSQRDVQRPDDQRNRPDESLAHLLARERYLPGPTHGFRGSRRRAGGSAKKRGRTPVVPCSHKPGADCDVHASAAAGRRVLSRRDAGVPSRIVAPHADSVILSRRSAAKNLKLRRCCGESLLDYPG